MAEETGQEDPGTLRDLLEQGARLSFFQALLLFERLGGVPLGAEGPAHRERIRVRPSVSLAFPPSDVESVEQLDDERVQVTATFLGLYGVDSPLPNIYSEHIAQNVDEPGGARVRDFLDVFHHRLYSLLFRVWKKSRPVSRPLVSDSAGRGVDPLYDRLLALIGYSSQLGLGGRRRPRLSEVRMRVLRPRTAVGLEALLRHRLGYRCDVEQLEPRSVMIPANQLTRLGQRGCELGASLVVGRRVTDCNKIALHVEAASFAMFEDLTPEGADREQLDDAVRGYLKDPMAYDIEVKLASEHVPPWPLGERGTLGRSVWLGVPRPHATWRWRCRPLV
jgi:type VI secretion system protein ImpH